MRGVHRVHNWIMVGIMPAIALTVATRQLYLSTTDDLSTWKGGGMGMFAGTEDNTRYAKIYLTFADGRRQPLLRITDEQERLKKQALNYPNERNLRALASSIKATKWWASTTKNSSQPIWRGWEKGSGRDRTALRSLSGAGANSRGIGRLGN